MATSDALCRYYLEATVAIAEQPINDNPSECKRRIREYIEKEYGYNLRLQMSFNISANETCQDMVPQAIIVS